MVLDSVDAGVVLVQAGLLALLALPVDEEGRATSGQLARGLAIVVIIEGGVLDPGHRERAGSR